MTMRASHPQTHAPGRRGERTAMTRGKGPADWQESNSGPESLLETAVYKALIAGAERWAAAELTMPQLKVLLLLANSGSAPVSWLAARMSVSPPNITGILDRLEERGWVRRTSDPRDRRIVRIVLSDEGQTLLRDLFTAGTAQVHEAMSEMPADSLKALTAGLPALVQALDQHVPGGEGHSDRALS